MNPRLPSMTAPQLVRILERQDTSGFGNRDLTSFFATRTDVG